MNTKLAAIELDALFTQKYECSFENFPALIVETRRQYRRARDIETHNALLNRLLTMETDYTAWKLAKELIA